MTIRYGSIPRKNVAEWPAWNGFGNQSSVVEVLEVEDEPEDRPE